MVGSEVLFRIWTSRYCILSRASDQLKQASPLRPSSSELETAALCFADERRGDR
jgi:hypothetical protein